MTKANTNMTRGEQIAVMIDDLAGYTDGFTFIAQGDEMHLFTHNEVGYEGDIEQRYTPLKQEIQELAAKKNKLLADIKQKEKTVKLLDAALKAKAKL